jgi:hypothetical protein
MSTLALTVGEPADGQQVRRLEQPDAVDGIETDPGVQFIGDVGEAGAEKTGLHLGIG